LIAPSSIEPPRTHDRTYRGLNLRLAVFRALVADRHRQRALVQVADQVDDEHEECAEKKPRDENNPDHPHASQVASS
jgi:hypothetical protein